MKKFNIIRILLSALFLIFSAGANSQTVFEDPDFVEESIGRPDGAGWSGVVGLVFAEDGSRGYAWERGGRVWILDEQSPVTSPLLDISDEVLEWQAHGLLGFALDPDFATNGHMYLLYVVDRHHLEHCLEPVSGVGPPQCDAGYDSNTTISATRAVIGRITRYTGIKPAGDPDFSKAVSVDYNSRKVLVGETMQTGFPIISTTHGVGSLVFGVDGMLMASCGDSAEFGPPDVGNAAGSAFNEALADGVIAPKENVGAFRSQLLDSLNGKIIRIDPVTGDGVASNPFYDVANPRSAMSRVWALGLRQPFRMRLRPGTGSHDPADANPGALYIGDVGASSWEDLNVANRPGQNFGWPAFEGMEVHTEYWNAAPVNQDAADALGCSVKFTDLLQQDAIGSPAFPNPCDGGDITGFPTFLHSRPTMDWNHSQVNSRYPAFDTSNNPVAVTVGQPIPGTTNILVQGSPFAGNTSTGGVWYTGDSFPGDYKDTYFHGDFGGQWIKNLSLDEFDNPLLVRPFLSNAGGVVYLTTHPTSGQLYYVSWGSQIRKVIYAPGGNHPPEAVAAASEYYSANSSLLVNLVGDQSSDTESTVLVYDWDFGDNSPASSEINPQHTFTAPIDPNTNLPETAPVSFTVTLAVTDDGTPPLNDVDQLLISLNNTPPDISITSPAQGALYPMTGETTFDLLASIVDSEHGTAELTCAWQTVLHHNNHTHPDPFDYNCQTQTQIPPAGCDGNTYFYRVILSVTDAAGLETTDFRDIYPDCSTVPPPDPAVLTTIAVTPASTTVVDGDTRQFNANGYDQYGAPYALNNVSWSVTGGGTIDANGLFTATTVGGPFTVSAFDGGVSGNATVTIFETDLALNQSVSVSSERSSQFVKEHAVDGNPNTRWTSEFSDPQWIYVDLGTNYWIDRVVLNWASYARSYEIQISDDAVSWTTVFAETNGDGAIDDLTIPTVNARYVRVYGTQRSGPFGYALWEFEVYELVGPPPDPAILTTIAVTPATTTVFDGENRQFSAFGYDQYGAPYALNNVSWSVTGGGTIDANGLFTATTVGGPFTVSASDGGVSGDATVTVFNMHLALNQSVTVSSERSSQFVKEHAVDGNPNTRWTSEFSDPQWIYVDLGTNYWIDRVVLNWGSYARSYEIQISDDAVSWTTVFAETNGDGAIDDLTIPTVNARYVRVYGTQRSGPFGYALWEFEVYELVGPPPDPAILTTIAVTPATTTVFDGENRQFSAFGYDQYGAPYALNNVSWSVTGGGTIDANGLFTATTVGGPFTVSAFDGGVSGDATVTILNTHLALNRSVVASSDRSGAIKEYAVDGDPNTRWASEVSDPQWIYVDLGTIYLIDRVVLNWKDHATAYEIQVSNDAVSWTTVFSEFSGDGGIDDLALPTVNARYVRMYGTQRGTPFGYVLWEFEVHESDGQPSDPAVLTTIAVTPASTTVVDGDTRQFNANGYDQYGAPYSLNDVSWSVTGGGTIDPNGLFTAMTGGGPFTVSASDGGVSGDATVTVFNMHLALNQSVTVSSERSSQFVKEHAVDGNPNTRWTSEFSDPQWIYVDLGTNYWIDRVVLNWGSYARSYEIQISDDAVSWTTVFAETNGDGAIDDLTIPTVNARYVRVYGTQRSGPFGYALWEFEVYELVGPPPDPAILTTIAVTPATTTVFDGENRQFSAFGYDQYGAPYALNNVSWSVTGGGTIDANGLFTATTVGGPFTVSAFDGGVSGNATVTIFETDLALNQSVSVSSERSSQFVKEHAVDGNPNTRWTSEFSDPQWIYVDLGTNYWIDRVVLNWASYARSYEIQISDDAVSWTTVFAETNGDGAIDDLTIPTVNARYVRVYGTQRSGPFGYALWEFEVYE